MIFFAVFLAVILILPTLLLNCGFGGLNIGFLAGGGNQCHGDLERHVNVYLDFFLSNLETFSILLIFFLLVSFVYYVRPAIRAIANLGKFRQYWFLNHNWRMKPFDHLINALAKGLIHPKNPVFSQS